LKLDNLLEQISQEPESIEFNQVISVIDHYYQYRPTKFKNGLGEAAVENQAGTNEGSCKIFYFAKLHQLDHQATLHCFGTYYREDVLENPGAESHQNIRRFMIDGMDGIEFSGEALVAK